MICSWFGVFPGHSVSRFEVGTCKPSIISMSLTYTFCPALRVKLARGDNIDTMAKEQKHTVQSPLAELVKPGTMRQEAIPGLERFAHYDTSRFSIKRIAFTLRRGADAIKAVMSRDGIRGHMLRTEHHTSGSSSALYWSEGENKKVVAEAL